MIFSLETVRRPAKAQKDKRIIKSSVLELGSLREISVIWLIAIQIFKQETAKIMYLHLLWMGNLLRRNRVPPMILTT
jgi:hypothetical protein